MNLNCGKVYDPFTKNVGTEVLHNFRKKGFKGFASHVNK